MTVVPFFASGDPGKRTYGLALWKEARLLWAGLVEPPTLKVGPLTNRALAWDTMGRAVALEISLHSKSAPVHLLLEIPQVYGPKIDNNDLLDLAGVQGAVCGYVGGIVEWSPLPREWKGQLPKSVTKTRVDAALSNEEKSIIRWPAQSLAHNVYDAIHLGLVHLQRKRFRT